MWMVTDNPGHITAGDMSRFKARACCRCGREKLSLTWSRRIDGPHYDRHDVIKYGVECYYCEESNTTYRGFNTPEEAVKYWNNINQGAPFIGEGPQTKQARLASDQEQVTEKRSWW